MELPEDRMSEAEVSLRLAFHLLTYATSNGRVSVAIDGAQVKVHGSEVFPISMFLESHGWAMAEQKGKNPWQGCYHRGPMELIVTAQSGIGDVVAQIGARRVRVEAKKGPLVRKDGSPEYPLAREAIGQLMTIDKVDTNDVLVVAVPQTAMFRSLVERWRQRPLIEANDIHFALVGRDGSVEGLPEFLGAESTPSEFAPSQPLPEGRYRHFKGNYYIVVGSARSSETCEEMIVYRQDYGERALWVRPKAMFLDTVEHNGQQVPRFQFVGDVERELNSDVR